MADDLSSSSTETVTYEEHCQNHGYPLSLNPNTSLPSSINPTENINSYSDFLHDIDEALHKADPKLDRAPSRRKIDPSSPPWLNGECNQIIRVRLAKLKKYLNSPTYENFPDYQKWKAKTTKKLKSIKSANSLSFCESLSVNSPISTVWAKVRSFRHRLLSPPSPTTCSVDLEAIEHMNSYVQDFIKMSNDFSNIEIPLLPVSFTDANSSNTNLPEISLTRLLHIFNNIFETGVFPLGWRDFLVFLFPKSTLRKFRPIALASDPRMRKIFAPTMHPTRSLRLPNSTNFWQWSEEAVIPECVRFLLPPWISPAHGFFLALLLPFSIWL